MTPTMAIARYQSSARMKGKKITPAIAPITPTQPALESHLGTASPADTVRTAISAALASPKTTKANGKNSSAVRRSTSPSAGSGFSPNSTAPAMPAPPISAATVRAPAPSTPRPETTRPVAGLSANHSRSPLQNHTHAIAPTISA